LLLKALLHRGPEARASWQAFCARIDDLPSLFRTDTGGRNRLSPLLLLAIRENNDWQVDPGLLTVLRTAFLREELRSDAYRKIAGEAYATLSEEGIRFLVLKGAALSETVYPEPCYRHAHDVDLLVPEDDLKGAEDVLKKVGFRRVSSLTRRRASVLRHPSELPLLLHSQLYRYPFYRTGAAKLWERSRKAMVSGVGDVSILSPEDNLVHALGHASYCPSRSSLLWVTDAWMILQGQERLQWSYLEEQVRESRLELPLFVMFRYLRNEFHAPVPEDALARFAALASRAGKLRRDAALYGARQARGRPPGLTGLNKPDWRGSLTLMFWHLFPSRDYVSWAYNEPGPVSIPIIYLMRPFSYLAERLKWRIRGLLRSWAVR
jgi:hypothetical protein